MPEIGEGVIVSEDAVSYTSGDMTLTARQGVASNVITPLGFTRLAFTVWLSTARTMYLVDSDGNLGTLGVTFGADAPASFEMPWSGKPFSIRFSGATTVRKLVINGR